MAWGGEFILKKRVVVFQVGHDSVLCLLWFQPEKNIYIYKKIFQTSSAGAHITEHTPTRSCLLSQPRWGGPDHRNQSFPHLPRAAFSRYRPERCQGLSHVRTTGPTERFSVSSPLQGVFGLVTLWLLLRASQAGRSWCGDAAWAWRSRHGLQPQGHSQDTSG